MIKTKQKMDYAWVVIFLCFLMEFVILGFCSGNKSLFLSAITDALDLKRGLFSVKDSLRYITTAVIYLFFGSLVQRFGVKKLIAAGAASLTLSLTLEIVSTRIIGFYFSGVFLGIGLALTTTTMATTIIRRWCSGPNVGKILGIVLGANGVGAALSAQVLSPMIYDENDPFGYRRAYMTVIPCVIIVAVIVLIFLKELPKQEGNGQKTKKKAARGQSWPGIPYEQLKRRPSLYLALLCVMLTGMMLQGMSGVAVAHMTDNGLTPTFVAGVTSFGSLLLTCSKFIAGASYDRFGLRVTVFVSHSVAILAMILLTLIDASPLGMALAVAYKILDALALPLETIMLSLITNDLFGSASFDKLLGMVSAANTIGYALGAPLLNTCYDITGTYVPVFLAFACVMLGVLVVFQLLARSAQKERAIVLARESEQAAGSNPV